MFVYSATASLDLSKFNTEAPNPCINEFHWGSVEPSVEIRIKSSLGYQAMPISVERAFSGQVIRLTSSRFTPVLPPPVRSLSGRR